MPLMDNLKRFVRGEDYDDEYVADEEQENEEEFPDGGTTARYQTAAQAAEPAPAASAAPAAAPAAPAAAPAAQAAETPSYSSFGTANFASATASFARSSDSEKGRPFMNANSQLSVVLVTPEKYTNAGEIAKHLLERRTVVLNMEGTNREVARRLLDFLGGVAYAQDGKVRRVASNTYIITPAYVKVEGELDNEAGESEEIIGQD